MGQTERAVALATQLWVENKIKESCGVELLWENASPTSEFAAQTINVGLAEGEKGVLRWYATNENTEMIETPISKFGKHQFMEYLTPFGMFKKAFLCTENSIIVTDTKKYLYTNTWDSTVNNIYCVPYQVVKYK